MAFNSIEEIENYFRTHLSGMRGIEEYGYDEIEEYEFDSEIREGIETYNNETEKFLKKHNIELKDEDYDVIIAIFKHCEDEKISKDILKKIFKEKFKISFKGRYLKSIFVHEYLM